MKARLFLISILLLFSISFRGSFTPDSRPVTHTVVMNKMKFEPAELVVKRGDSVIFINRDLVIHNITEEKKTWASPTLAPNSSWSLLVKEDVKYYCSFHPMMKGILVVKKE